MKTMIDTNLIEKIRLMDLEFEATLTRIRENLNSGSLRDDCFQSMAISNFRHHLFELGMHLGYNARSDTEFQSLFSLIVNRPVKQLWAPEYVLNGAKSAQKSVVDYSEIEKGYLILPSTFIMGGVKYFVKRGEEVEFNDITYSVTDYSPTKFDHKNHPYEVGLSYIRSVRGDVSDKIEGTSGLALIGALETQREYRELKIPFSRVLQDFVKNH